MASHTLVMRGSLAEFQLPDVLQVVGVSRQHTLIELRQSDGRRAGFIAMKAGHVLGCESQRSRGRDAFFELFEESPEIFHVFRLPDKSQYSDPLGPLSGLLFEAADRPRTEVSPPPMPEPPPPLPPEPPKATAAAPAEVRQVTPPRVVRKRPVRSTRPGPSARPQRSKVVVAVASPKGGVGKTTITLNLALSLAERGLRTAIVDADVNGDILSLIDARGRVELGALELLDRPEDVASALRKTACPNLSILPACGASVPLSALDRRDFGDRWDRLIAAVEATTDVVMVDCPAGMFHTTGAVLRAATHVVGVFQAEMVSSRSFDRFMHGLDAVPIEVRPKLAGVVVNMFQGRADASLEAFHRICDDGERHRLFDTTIPRSDAFGEACVIGQPLRSAGATSSPIAWLFDMLAEEVCHRVELAPGAERAREHKRFLD